MERATITENGRLSEIELNGMGHCYFQCLWPKNALESSSRYVFLDSSHFSSATNFCCCFRLCKRLMFFDSQVLNLWMVLSCLRLKWRKKGRRSYCWLDYPYVWYSTLNWTFFWHRTIVFGVPYDRHQTVSIIIVCQITPRRRKKKRTENKSKCIWCGETTSIGISLNCADRCHALCVKIGCGWVNFTSSSISFPLFNGRK